MKLVMAVTSDHVESPVTAVYRQHLLILPDIQLIMLRHVAVILQRL